MHISWLGQTCIKIQTKNGREDDVVTLVDPYRPDKGDFPRTLAAQLALYTRGQKDSITITQNPFIADTLGEIEVKDVMVYALPGIDGELIFKINAEGISLLHLGRGTKQIENELLEKIGNIDILLVPVGGNSIYATPEEAAKIITAVEPRIVIPTGYRTDTDPSANDLSGFIKESGFAPESTEKKLVIKKKDLPVEDTKLIVLEKNY